ncbi:hypothetical protein GA707_17105 [Nostocoides sp. F2B08]|uniref:hypothetical protein n=1 Tax=Nostocoides sp. F2B08 TaxID=2653936 RepID=UPI0012632615|nr:hypothetical protein [Tetrasphaera sp. F2B08]KAB7741920.1 hypothetical protein GA707_17105 [Tetrasphaera sp. F2B08]
MRVPDLPSGAVRPLVASRARDDRVRIGIASMVGREDGLAEVLTRLVPQADEVFVYLNGMSEVPPGLRGEDRVRFVTGPDLGDRAKFVFMDGFEGYYLLCDDDITYPPFYVRAIVDGIERYGRRAVVGWHGSLITEAYTDFYDVKGSREVVAFNREVRTDVPVHMLGTGIAGFHTSTIDIALEDFLLPNMGDVWLAFAAQRQRVPMVVLSHERGWASPMVRGARSISRESTQRAGSGLDVGRTVTTLVGAWPRWQTFPAEPVTTNAPPEITVVATDSALADRLRAVGWRVFAVPALVDAPGGPAIVDLVGVPPSEWPVAGELVAGVERGSRLLLRVDAAGVAALADRTTWRDLLQRTTVLVPENVTVDAPVARIVTEPATLGRPPGPRVLRDGLTGVLTVGRRSEVALHGASDVAVTSADETLGDDPGLETVDAEVRRRQAVVVGDDPRARIVVESALRAGVPVVDHGGSLAVRSLLGDLAVGLEDDLALPAVLRPVLREPSTWEAWSKATHARAGLLAGSGPTAVLAARLRAALVHV